MSTMTVVVTRNISPRTRGFLASTMLEIAAGVYTAPRLSPAVRNRIWKVLEEWFVLEKDASVIMLWREPATPGEQAVRTLGVPPVTLVDMDGLLLMGKPCPEETAETRWRKAYLGKSPNHAT